MKHKYADVIIHWAVGGRVDFKNEHTGGAWCIWSVDGTPSFCHITTEWRIAKQFRVFVCEDGWVGIVKDADSAARAESLQDFERWLTDWITYE